MNRTAAIVTILLVAGFQAFSTATQRFEHERQPQLEQRSTAAVQEPTGYTAACFATNLDSESRDLAATIFDWRGNNVTATSSCGAHQGPGITCQATAQFTDSALRCVVSTSGSAARLRGSLSTSAGPYPFTLGQPANSTVTAE
ncbi:MAG: hypothetical protein ABJA98_12515 [Acidobacteriota bacterium]